MHQNSIMTYHRVFRAAEVWVVRFVIKKKEKIASILTIIKVL